ncbi:MAG: hypothetical protein ACLGIK_10090, partial [Gemmatimonadota bacterium]
MHSRPPSPVSRLITSVALALAVGAPTTAGPQGFLRPADINALPSKPADARIAYGPDSLQFGELRLPGGTGPFAVAIVIHGGCWVHGYAAAQNSAALADALRDALRRRGLEVTHRELAEGDDLAELATHAADTGHD